MSLLSASSLSAIEQQILAYIADELVREDGFSIDADENLLTGAYIDSVGIMRLIAHLESRFAVTIPPADLVPDNFRTVRIMAAYLVRRGART